MTVILIFVLGTWLYTQGKATVGRDRQLHGLRHHADRPHGQASGFVCRVFFQMPALADFFRVLDHAVDRAGQARRPRYRPRQGRCRLRGCRASPTTAGVRRWRISRCTCRPARRGACRPDRRGQEHGAVAAASHVGPAVGRHPHRRHRPSRHHPGIAAPQHRRGVPGQHAVLPHDRRQPADRQARRDAGRDRAGRQLAEAHDFIMRQPQRLRHAGRRTRHHPVGRRAPAAGDRPRAAEGPADPDPRRGDQRARRA